MNYTTLRLSGIGEIPVSAAEGSAAQVSLTGRQALALLRILERNRAALEREAEAERDREYGRGPGAHAAEVPQKIRKGDPRLGKRAITYGDHHFDGKVTAILRYSNGVEQIEVTQKVYALDSPKPGTALAWVHAGNKREGLASFEAKSEQLARRLSTNGLSPERMAPEADYDARRL